MLIVLCWHFVYDIPLRAVYDVLNVVCVCFCVCVFGVLRGVLIVVVLFAVFC